MVLDQLELLGGEVIPVLRKELEARRDPRDAAGPPTHEAAGQGQVRRRRAAPAAPEREPRRQRHRRLPVPGHASSSGRVPVGGLTAMARPEHPANDAWESLLTAHATLMRRFAAAGRVGGPVDAGVRRPLHAVQVPGRRSASPTSTGTCCSSQPALSRMVDRLVDRGLVVATARTRRRCAHRRVGLTEAGRDAAAQRSAGLTPATSPRAMAPLTPEELPPARLTLSLPSLQGAQSHDRATQDERSASSSSTRASSDPSSTRLLADRAAQRVGRRSAPNAATRCSPGSSTCARSPPTAPPR